MNRILWDYVDTGTLNPVFLKKMLERKIMFGQFDENDLPNIQRYFLEISMTPYWEYYFTIYFRKYAPHQDTGTVSELDR